VAFCPDEGARDVVHGWFAAEYAVSHRAAECRSRAFSGLRRRASPSGKACFAAARGIVPDDPVNTADCSELAGHKARFPIRECCHHPRRWIAGLGSSQGGRVTIIRQRSRATSCCDTCWGQRGPTPVSLPRVVEGRAGSRFVPSGGFVGCLRRNQPGGRRPPGWTKSDRRDQQPPFR